MSTPLCLPALRFRFDRPFALLCVMRADWGQDHANDSFAGGDRSREGRGRKERATRTPVELLQFNLRALRARGLGEAGNGKC